MYKAKSIKELRKLLDDKKVTKEELFEESTSLAKKYQEDYNSFVTILDKISLDTPDCTERSLKQHISNIRKKLMAADGRDHIQAIYGIGFKLI